MTKQEIMSRITFLDDRFNYLDWERIKAVDEGNYERTQEIDKEQSGLVEMVEKLRAKLGRKEV